MKSGLVLLVAASAALVTAELIEPCENLWDRYPECGLPCIISAMKTIECMVKKDMWCACVNNYKMIEFVKPCILKACPLSECFRTKQVYEQICKELEAVEGKKNKEKHELWKAEHDVLDKEKDMLKKEMQEKEKAKMEEKEKKKEEKEKKKEEKEKKKGKGKKHVVTTMAIPTETSIPGVDEEDPDGPYEEPDEGPDEGPYGEPEEGPAMEFYQTQLQAWGKDSGEERDGDEDDDE